MKLSHAMRLGAMLKPQCYGHLSTRGSRTCAFGAAFDALGILAEVEETSLVLTAPGRWPWILTEMCHPVTGRTFAALNIIVLLNDQSLWTREEIADWVEKVEPAEDLPSPAPSPVDVEQVIA